MSLVGNLEDLGLGEILQIVSLSRKSGVLQLNSRDRDGRVIFSDGQVIRAMASTFPENLGDLVLRNGLADMETLKQALVIQQESDDDRRIGDILVDPQSSDVVYAAAQGPLWNSSGDRGLYKTTDGGTTFTAREKKILRGIKP